MGCHIVKRHDSCHGDAWDPHCCNTRVLMIQNQRRVRHLLVLGGGDLLQEVGDALALRQRKAYCGEEGEHLIARAMEHHVTCANTSAIS